jgi:hypothetical protein
MPKLPEKYDVTFVTPKKVSQTEVYGEAAK